MKKSKLIIFTALIIGTLALAGCFDVPGSYGGYGYPSYGYGLGGYGLGGYPALGYGGWGDYGGWGNGWGNYGWGHHDWDHDDWDHDGWGHWGGLEHHGWAFAGQPHGFGHFANPGFNVAHNGRFGFGGMNFARGRVGGFGARGFHGGGFHGGGFHGGGHGRH